MSNSSASQAPLRIVSVLLSEGVIPNPRNPVLHPGVIRTLALQIHLQQIQGDAKAPHTEDNQKDFRIKELLQHALFPPSFR